MTGAHWMVTTDERTARLYRIESRPGGHLHVEAEDEVANGWEEHEHGRPSPRAGKNGVTYASQGHEDETRRDRFAKAVATWLDQQTQRRSIMRVAVFASPRFLGALRVAWSPRVAGRINEHQADLASLTAAQLAQHRAVVELMKGMKA